MNFYATQFNIHSLFRYYFGLTLFTILVLSPISGQQSNLDCNTSTPWILPTFPVTETHTSPGASCWEGDPSCPGSHVPANVINSSTTDYATGTIAVAGSLTLRVTDATNDYDAGNFAGFRLSSGLLELGVFTSITISTYLDNTLQQEVSSGSLLVVDADLSIDQFDLGFITSMPYDAIQITIDNALGLGSYNVYYALMTDFCPGPGLDCNTPTALNQPIYPVTIDYLNTGTSGITVGNVLNPEFAISADATDYASLVNFASIAGSTFISVEEQITDYPVGTFVGFDLQNLTVLGAGILNYVTVTSYLNDVQQESFTGPDLLISASAINNSGRQTVGFVTTTAVDEVKLTINQPAGVNLGTTRVYSAVFQEFCAGPEPECNTLTPIHLPEYPVFIDGEHTGFTGVACALCDVENAGNVIDANLSNWAEIDVAAGVTSVGSLAVKDQLADYPAGTFAGFHIENPALVEADVLTGITISTYLNGVLQESETNLGALVTVGSGLLVGSGEQYVGFVTTVPFDEVKISLANIIGSFEIGTTRIYGAVVESFCPAAIECDTTYYLTNPEFPVYIDAFLTGIDGVACVACEVEDEQNVITADTSDYATITIVAGALGYGSIAVADALYTYPEGTFAGFVIQDLNFLLEAELFETLTISTYNNGVLQESKSGADLYDLAVSVYFIGDTSGTYNVGFETSLPFDEIRITTGALATAINLIRVYSAFVDTRNSQGELLFCNGPVAVDDVAITDEDVAVIIDVLANDLANNNEITGPIIVTPPQNGTVVVNPDSTVTYTPDPDFTGMDTFTYAICNANMPAQCDTAQVIITVNPDNDPPVAVDDVAYTNEDTPVSIDVLENDSDPDSPLRTPTIVDNPSNGVVSVNPSDSTILYTPASGFVGIDSFTYSICDEEIPPLCDTATVIVYVAGSTDTTVFEIPAELPLILCVSAWVEFQGLFETLDVCGMPTHGMVTIIDTCLYYTPDPGYIGEDTLCMFACDVNGVCDTNIVVALIGPPLPVRWLSFEVVNTSTGASLKWATSHETNNAGFDIERSQDGIHFTKIGNVSAGLNGQNIQSYNFIDSNPFKGVNYYRVRQNDFDGKALYSVVRTIHWNSGKFGVTTWPNPSPGELTLDVQNASGAEFDVHVYSLSGKTVYYNVVQNTLPYTKLNISVAEPGMYMVVIDSGTDRITQRILIVK